MGAARTASQSPNPKFKQGLENPKKMPEGQKRVMGFAELMLTGATGSGIIGRKGKATMKEEEEEQPTKDTSKDDFGMENVRKRLLERAKQERIARQNQFTREKEVYDQSLPDSVKKKMQKNPLQFMVRGG
jgi:DMSO/TMAO reductase YedYZ molybdopterin-dependent catalytic subunit